MFWDTVLGNQLANILISELPQLNQPKKQILRECDSDERIRYELENKLMEGFRLHTSIQLQNGKTILVFEK